MGLWNTVRAVLVASAVGTSLVACGQSPAWPTQPVEEVPTLQLVAACTTYAACFRSFERTQAFATRCGGCAAATNALVSVRARLDTLYLEENREAIEQEERDRARPAVKPRAQVQTFPDPNAPERERQVAVLNGRAECVATGELARCDETLATEEERTACRQDCETLGQRAGDARLRQAVRECVHGDGKASCGAATPWTAAAGLEKCARRCDELRKAWGRFNATHALCCDGSRSPSCTNESFGRGCCSHHGGGCLEDPPAME